MLHKEPGPTADWLRDLLGIDLTGPGQPAARGVTRPAW
jgi:hypothetical protein